MKQSTFLLLAGALLIFTTSCTNSPKSDEAKISEEKKVTESPGEVYVIDTSSSTIRFIGTKVTGFHTGEIHLKNGEVTVSNDGITGGNFTFDANSILIIGPKGSDAKGNMKLTGHLKSGDFFEADTYPEITFEVTKITPVNETVNEADDPRQAELTKYKVTNPTHKVSGNLTIRDVTRNIEFPAHISVNGDEAEATAKFNIDRREWGITYPGAPDDLIRDAVHVGLSIKATRKGYM
jgi:polyisoprenoid-binding protein YceI